MSKERLSELTEKQQENKKEDKKAFKKFIWILAASFLVGAGSGAGGVIVGNLLNDSAAKEKIITLLRYPAIYGGYLFTTILLVLCIVLYKKSRREYMAWDQEDDKVLIGIETKMSYVCWFANLMMYGTCFFFSVGVWATDIGAVKHAIKQESGILWNSLIAVIIVFLHMAYSLIASCIVSQKAVNLSKEINPEKTGSIYDSKFHDKWMEHCDEAERFTIYKCSFKTFKVMQTTGMALWLVCLVGQLVFNTGAFATIIVTIFMIIQTSVYCMQAIYFAKHPSEVMK